MVPSMIFLILNWGKTACHLKFNIQNIFCKLIGVHQNYSWVYIFFSIINRKISFKIIFKITVGIKKTAICWFDKNVLLFCFFFDKKTSKLFMKPKKKQFMSKYLCIFKSTGHRPHQCTTCLKTFSQKCALKLHILSHTMGIVVKWIENTN